MFQALLKKMFTSRKFVVMLVGFLVKALTPLATKYGVDITAVDQALNEYAPVIMTWLVGQAAVDTAKELYVLPPPPPEADGVPQ